jgi:hypothetical protein
MSTESQLREKLRKIEALFAGAGTAGERLAAEAALERVRARLVARHSGFDWSIPSQLRTGMSCGATRISMLRGTPG